MENNVEVSFDFIKQLKKQILSSRYIVAKIANAESLKLYFTIGSLLEQKFSTEKWGTKILDTISTQLQQELPGLRGFSAKNLSKMSVFYTAWRKNEPIYSLTTSKLDSAKASIGSLTTNQLKLKETNNENVDAFLNVAFKKGKFKPEYIGKMNFYLSALDDMVRQPHENPSIGIILCKAKDDKKVEYSFRDFNKPMGVATFTTSETLPSELQKSIPDAETFKKLLD